jgi:hypothetical protein
LLLTARAICQPGSTLRTAGATLESEPTTSAVFCGLAGAFEVVTFSMDHRLRSMIKPTLAAGWQFH